MSNPFECNVCKKRVHGRNVNDLKCCEGAKFTALVKICLLAPKKEITENTVVHTSPDSFGGKPLPAGAEWVTMCNLPSLMTRQGQRVVTRWPGAVTCETCLKKYEEKLKELEEKEYQDNIEYIDN